MDPSTQHPPPRRTPRKARDRAPSHTRTAHRQREASAPNTDDTKVAPDKEDVELKSTVVDIDSVRVEANEENLGLLEAAEQEDALKRRDLGVFEWLLMISVLALVLLFLPISIWFCVKVVREHERAVIFRLGHQLRGRARGPGLLFYLPVLDVCHKVDIRLRMLTIPPHVAVSKDLARLEVSAVCYYRVENVAVCSAALCSVTAVLQSVVQASLRDTLAQHTLGYLLLQRRRLALQLQAAADSVACRWGIRVERADIEEVSFPAELQQSLPAQLQARRQQQQLRVGERAARETLGSSIGQLQPALVLPFSPELLGAIPDLSTLPLPPPPPPIAAEGDGLTTEGEGDTDSPMM